MCRNGWRATVASCLALASSLYANAACAFVKTCHQGITTDALDTAAWPLGAASPPLTAEQNRLRNELSIDLAPRVTGFWQMSALVGNQYNDGGSFDAKDVVALAEYAAKPDGQREHCLRAPDDDGPAGDARALAACKAYILEQLGVALGDGDAPDLAATEPIRLHLVFRGDADIPVSRYAFHLGQATHALQDSFTHTFRAPDLRQVRTVLNWVDWVRGASYAEARDGFHHVLALDYCGPSDVGGLERRMAAGQATTELIAAVARDEGGRAGRLARASAVLDGWLTVGETCTADNQWCNAPERTLVSPLGCAVAPRSGGPRAAPLMLTLLAAVTLLGGRSGRRRRGRSGVIGLAAVLTTALGPSARAAEDPGRGESKGGVVAKASPEEQQQLQSRPFGVLVQGGFSLDNAGYDVGVGVRYDLNHLFTVGLGVEYSPWLSLETSRSTRGTTNAFATGSYRLDVRDYLELHIMAAAGVSVLNYATWAAPKGSVGPYFALSPLGVGIRMTGHLRLLIDPAELVVSIPQTTGIPLAYREHRFSVAVQANF